ncbi:MAG: hypothetical protein JF565_04800 [Propionibacteriales bacterium]|jgi:hypothetical protein|nr:hypothetical protein [Propionibacteriales bacterium]
MRLTRPAKLLASTAVALAACVLSSCGGGTHPSSSPRDTGSGATVTGPSSSPTASPVRFESPEYGYTVTLPAGWTATQAYSKWDGKAELSKDSFDIDRFVGPPPTISFAAAASWTHGLAAYARYLIASNVRYHSGTCPTRPDGQVGIAIGGRPGVLLEYNCGILINIAATVRHGVGYVFTFRDDNVQAASDPTDHAAFAQMLGSVDFPH